MSTVLEPGCILNNTHTINLYNYDIIYSRTIHLESFTVWKMCLNLVVYLAIHNIWDSTFLKFKRPQIKRAQLSL